MYGVMNLHNQSRNTMEKSEVRKIIVDIIAEIAPDEDLSNLKKGIKVYGEEELSNLIEDYNS